MLVEDFKYLRGYTKTEHEMKVRIGQAWGALNSLNKVWKSPLKEPTKSKVFKATVETILLYGSDSWTLTKSLTKSIDVTCYV